MKNYSCISPFATSSEVCYPEYSDNFADKSDYSVGWKPLIKLKQPSKYWRMIEPWKYRSSYQLRTIGVSGVLSKYPGDGYASQLGRTKNNSNIVAKFLYNNNWTDRATKAVFIELNVYSVDVNLFNIINLVLERNAYGKWITSYEIKTNRLLLSFSEMSAFLVFCFLLFILITTYFFLDIFMKACNSKIIKYLSNAWNLVDITILFLTIVYIAFFFKRSQYVESLIFELEVKKNNEFVSFHWATLFDEFTNSLSGFLVCIATIRFWKILNFAATFRMLSQTLSKSISSLFSTTILTGIILMGICSCIYIINGTETKLFNTPLRTLTSLTALAFGFTSKIEYENLLRGGKFLGMILYFLQLSIVNIFLLNMFITIVCVYFASVKDKMRGYKQDFKFWDYTKLKMRSIFLKPKVATLNRKMIKIRHQNYSLSSAKFLGSVLESHLNYLEIYLKQHKYKKESDYARKLARISHEHK